MKPQYWLQKTAIGEEISLVCAPLLHRMLAWFIDLIVVLLIQTILSLFMLVEKIKQFLDIETQDIITSSTLALFILINYLVQTGYYFFCEYKFGYTIGKRLLSLKVISHTGGRPSLEAILWRSLLRPIEAGFIPLLAALFVILRKDGRRLGDILGGSLVILDGIELTELSNSPTYHTPLENTAISVDHLANHLPEMKLIALQKLAKIYPSLTAQQKHWFETQIMDWLPPESKNFFSTKQPLKLNSPTS